ncbi:MAG: hypothetical protein WBA41_28055 [Rivularia sp. (in: cyanobacteria)]
MQTKLPYIAQENFVTLSNKASKYCRQVIATAPDTKKIVVVKLIKLGQIIESRHETNKPVRIIKEELIKYFLQ